MWWVAVGVVCGWCGGGGRLVAVDLACGGYVGRW